MIGCLILWHKNTGSNSNTSPLFWSCVFKHLRNTEDCHSESYVCHLKFSSCPASYTNLITLINIYSVNDSEIVPHPTRNFNKKRYSRLLNLPPPRHLVYVPEQIFTVINAWLRLPVLQLGLCSADQACGAQRLSVNFSTWKKIGKFMKKRKRLLFLAQLGTS